MAKRHKPLKEGGAKQLGGDLSDRENPALRKESRQAVLNQSTVAPEDYPERTTTVAPRTGRKGARE